MSWNIWPMILKRASLLCTWKASNGPVVSCHRGPGGPDEAHHRLENGRSLAGAKAAMSHTGSLLGEDAVVDLALAAAGIIRVLTWWNCWPCPGPFSSSSPWRGRAWGSHRHRRFRDHRRRRLRRPWPGVGPLSRIPPGVGRGTHPWHKLHNPVDLWPLGMVTGSFTRVFKRAVAGLFADEHVDAVLGVGPCFTSPRHADLNIPGAVRELHSANPRHKPLAMLLYGDAAAHGPRWRNWIGNPMWPALTPWMRPSWAWRPPGVTGNLSRPRRPEILPCPSHLPAPCPCRQRGCWWGGGP